MTISRFQCNFTSKLHYELCLFCPPGGCTNQLMVNISPYVVHLPHLTIRSTRSSLSKPNPASKCQNLTLWNSPKRVFDNFRVPDMVDISVWGFNPNNFLQGTPWNWETAISGCLGHLFLPLLDFKEKLETRPKNTFFANDQLMLRS